MNAHAEVRGWRVTPARMAWLVGALTLVLIPHLDHIPWWVGACFAVLALWRLGAEMRGFPMPGRTLRLAICVLALAGVHASYGTITGRGPGVAMLTVLAGLKLLETRELRDAYVGCFLGFFLVVTNFLFSESISTGLYMFVVVAVLLGAMSAMTTTERVQIGLPERARLAVTVLAQAVPVMLILFVLFPRVSGPLWGLPKDARQGVSGLSETMTPGSLTQLGLSDAVAFRVHFDGTPPPRRTLYWRGPVLWQTDGQTWRRIRAAAFTEPVPFDASGSPADYVVTLEPHRRRMLFGLDLPATIPENGQMTEDFQLRSTRRVNERLRYRVRSYPQYRTLGLPRARREDALALAAEAHPAARALALEWRAATDSDQGLVERALDWFRAQPFVYTLSPKPLAGDTVDEFLFTTREGFCEYYAAAFTVLMRAAGVPARVVTGYQGGEYNPVGGYLIVRQRDAHAWTEVWLEGRGWVRVDPTGAVAPDRIERGIDVALPGAGARASLEIGVAAPVYQAWQRMRLTWDAVNSAWNEWVLGYGPLRQRLLLGRFGIDASDLMALALGILAGVGLVLGAVTLWLMRRPYTRDPALRAWRRFERRLARSGLAREPAEGPLDYAGRVSLARPALAAEVGAIADLYVRLRYAGADEDARALERAVSAFRA